VSTRLLAATGEGGPSIDAIDLLEAELVREVERVLHAALTRDGPTITVTNEVGAGVVPEWPLGRAYRDLLGSVNQRVAAAAGRAWLLVAGRALPLPPTDLED
jgi:adenosylcobinamide kinase/adenosylcobinamide-phosphate guanylyltransferase